jgi:hypothetical protein
VLVRTWHVIRNWPGVSLICCVSQCYVGLCRSVRRVLMQPVCCSVLMVHGLCLPAWCLRGLHLLSLSFLGFPHPLLL